MFKFIDVTSYRGSVWNRYVYQPRYIGKIFYRYQKVKNVGIGSYAFIQTSLNQVLTQTYRYIYFFGHKCLGPKRGEVRVRVGLMIKE